MPTVRIVVHKTCASSRKLFNELKSRGLLGRVNVVAANGYSILRMGLLSVPAAVVGGEVVLVDPISVEEVETLTSGKALGELDLESAENNFIEATIHSGALVAAIVLHKSLKPAMSLAWVSAATKSRLYTNGREVVEVLLSRLRNSWESILKDNWETFVKAAAFSLTREAYWAGVSEVSRDLIALWLLSKASLGRIGLPQTPKRPEATDEVYEVVRANWDRWWRRVEEEQRIIRSDAEFMSLPEED